MEATQKGGRWQDLEERKTIFLKLRLEANTTKLLSNHQEKVIIYMK